jgi:hypothetical protein
MKYARFDYSKALYQFHKSFPFVAFAQCPDPGWDQRAYDDYRRSNQQVFDSF